MSMRFRVRSYVEGSDPLPSLDVTTNSERVAADEAMARALRHGWPNVGVLAEGERPRRGDEARAWTHAVAASPGLQFLTAGARGLLAVTAGFGIAGFDSRDTAYSALAAAELEAHDLVIVRDGRLFITIDGARVILAALDATPERNPSP